MRLTAATLEHRVFVCPIVAGSGGRLFGEGLPPRMLRHVEATTTAAVVVVSVHERGGPLVTGSLDAP